MVEDRVANPYLGSLPSRLLGIIIIILVIMIIVIIAIIMISAMMALMAALTPLLCLRIMMMSRIIPTPLALIARVFCSICRGNDDDDEHGDDDPPITGVYTYHQFDNWIASAGMEYKILLKMTKHS